jgi:deaminated glutathione amidase
MRVAAVQTTAGPDRSHNLGAAGALVEDAAGAGASLVVLPEYFSVAGGPDHLRRYAEPLTGPTVTWASGVARRLRIHLVAGSVPEQPPDGARTDGRLFNTSCLITPTGAIQAVYRKIHLFDVSVEGAASQESATVAPGDALVASRLGPSREENGGSAPVLGLSLCYDLRFPELYRILTLTGATIMAVPSAFTAATGPAHWELLLRARAVENQVFVIGAGQVGTLPPGMPPCYGHSMVVDPWGSILAERTDPSPGVVLADLDLDAQVKIRSELPVLSNRRPDAYRWPHGESGGDGRTGR